MLKFNNSIVLNKVCIGWHFSSNKYAYRDVYSTLKRMCSKSTSKSLFVRNVSSLIAVNILFFSVEVTGRVI